MPGEGNLKRQQKRDFWVHPQTLSLLPSFVFVWGS